MQIKRKEIIQTQRELSELIGVPGHEQEVSDYLLSMLDTVLPNAWTDPIGNILGVREGNDPNGLKILLDAHMDEVGFMINHIDKNGFIRVDTLGGIDKRVLLGSQIVLQTEKNDRIMGIFGSAPPHITSSEEREKVPEVKDMFVDIGCSSYEEVREKGLDIGSVGTFHTQFRQLDDETLIGKGFDDRTACNVVLQVLKALSDEDIDNTIMVNFAVQEEVGTRGARVGAYTLEPNIALALENTIASDVPGVKDHKIVTALGKGPALTVADRSVIVPRKIIHRLKQAAKECGVQYQYKKPTYGGCDAGAIMLTRHGVPSGVVSVPCRYIHGPVGLLKIQDIENTIKLVKTFCKLL